MMQKVVKENKEQIKDRILKDVSSKRIKGISWLQKEYGIGFKLAKEIYFDSLKNNDSDK